MAIRIDNDASEIAATAPVDNMTVVTHNVRDFEGTGVVVVDTWQG